MIRKSINRILRSLALQNPNSPGLNYKEFKRRLTLESFVSSQEAMLKLRLGLLESFMYPADAVESPEAQNSGNSEKKKIAEQKREIELEDMKIRRALGKETVWSLEPGSLTIVDLSCPFVDESAASALFNICLGIFMEQRVESGRILALDEAHKVGSRPNDGQSH